MSSEKIQKNLYQIVIDDLMKRIEARDFSFDTPICTEKQVAEEYHVSNITAKRAINELEHMGVLYRKRGVGSFVSREKFAKVNEVAEQDATQVFAFVLPFAINSGSVFVDMMQILNSRLNPQHGYISMYMTEWNTEKEREALLGLLGNRIAGLIYYPSSNRINLDLLDLFVIKGIPVIILSTTDSTPYLHNVVCDNFGGQQAVVNHLIELGHKKIAYMSSSSTNIEMPISERLGGYFLAMREAGLPLYNDFIVTKLDDGLMAGVLPIPAQKLERIKNHIRFFIENGVTAISCDNDGLAFYVMKCCEELSISVPRDMSITGFDGYTNIDYPDLHITTAYQNFKEIAERASDILLRSMNGYLLYGEKIVVKAELMHGETVAPCRQ